MLNAYQKIKYKNNKTKQKSNLMNCFKMVELISTTKKLSLSCKCLSVKPEEGRSWCCMSTLSGNSMSKLVPNSTRSHQDLLALQFPEFPSLEALFHTQETTLALSSISVVSMSCNTCNRVLIWNPSSLLTSVNKTGQFRQQYLFHLRTPTFQSKINK